MVPVTRQVEVKQVLAHELVGIVTKEIIILFYLLEQVKARGVEAILEAFWEVKVAGP